MKFNILRQALLAITLIISSGCGSSGQATLPTPKTTVEACKDLLPPGAANWITEVESVIDSLPETSGATFSERTASYKLWRLHEDFNNLYYLPILDNAVGIRNLGLGCMGKFDSVIQINRGLPIVGSRIFLCSVKGDSGDPLTGLFTCLDQSKLQKEVQTLIKEPLSKFNEDFDGPNLEFLQGLQPWTLSNANQDVYTNFSSFGKAFACQSYTNFADVSPAKFSQWMELLAWSWSHGSLPVDPVTGAPMSAADGTLPSLTLNWLTQGISPASEEFATTANSLFWNTAKNSKNLAIRGAGLVALAPLALDQTCAGVIKVMDKIVGTPSSMGDTAAAYGQIDGIYDGLTKCSSGELGNETECKITRVYSAYPILLDSFTEVEMELRKLSDFVLTTE